jgi:UDP-glucuronate 4-epimerase
MRTHLVTGAAGFIGFHLALRLLREGERVVGFDSVNDYYDVNLKRSRLVELEKVARSSPGEFRLIEADLADRSAIDQAFAQHRFDRVVHLAAQAGVRYSLTHPRSYVQSNLVGFINILEACRHQQVPHLTYASSSSVYGANRTLPFSVDHNVDHPLSLYAATKKANELMAHSYSHLYQLPTTGLRFFTVYGPWGRPDMALFIFTKAILEGKPIDVFNHGQMRRDFTYIDDIVEGVYRTSETIAAPDPKWSGEHPNPATSAAPYRIYNIGNSQPVSLDHFISVIEGKLDRRAIRNDLPMQPGDVAATYADIEALEQAVGFRPSTPIEVGIGRFIDWYRDYYRV